MDLKNTVLVTHRSCMDGSTCATVFIAAGGDRNNIRFSSPSHEETDDIVWELAQTWEGPIIVADASISLDLAEKLDAHFADIRILDHHKSAIPLAKFDWCEIDIENTRAGGKMLYDFLYTTSDGPVGSPLRNLLSLYSLVAAADDYDRWIRNIPESEDLAILHNSIKQQAFIDRFVKDPFLAFTPEEQFLINLEKKNRDEYVERKKGECFVVNKVIDGQEVNIGVVEAGDHQSVLGNAICEDPLIDVDVAVLINGRSVSFRGSRNCSVDLSKVAGLNLGGGHRLAAGTKISNILGESFAEMVFGKIKWE